MLIRIKYPMLAVMLFLILTLSCLAVAGAQQPTLTLGLYKNSGFSMGNDINGRWTVNAAVSQNVSFVEFYLDNRLQFNDTTAPFSWSFDTSSYAEGNYVISATAYYVNGESAVASVESNFVGFPLGYVVGVVVVAVVGFLVSLVASWFWIKKKAAQKMRLKQTSSCNTQ